MVYVAWRERAEGARVGVALKLAAARLAGAYALRLYLPASFIARLARNWLRGWRGIDVAVARMARAPWSQVLQRRPIRLGEIAKSDGNVSLSELAVLALAACDTAAGSEIIEIGTFDGRTTLNLAINARRSITIATLDLPAGQEPALAVEKSERRYIDKSASGARLRSCGTPWQAYAGRITQLHGDSATFDWSSHYGRAGLVFVDGSHAYAYAQLDSETALRLVTSHGMVIWHDYGVWPGVTRALDELERRRNLGLIHIEGTSLVYWRAPDIVNFVADAPAGQDYEDPLSLGLTAPALWDRSPEPELG